jgi:hypothetical protein
LRIILQKNLDLFLIMRRVWLVRLFPVTVDDGIDVLWVIFRRKEIDNCSLFRNLVFISPIAENSTSQMYEDEKGSSTFRISVERVGHIRWTDSQNCIYLRCGRCRIPNPYNMRGEGAIPRIIYDVYYVPYFLPFSNFVLFFTFPFLMIINFYIIKKLHLKNLSLPTTLVNAVLVYRNEVAKIKV